MCIVINRWRDFEPTDGYMRVVEKLKTVSLLRSFVEKIKWPGGTLGVLQTAAGGEDIVKLHYKSSDEQWYGEIVSNFS